MSLLWRKSGTNRSKIRSGAGRGVRHQVQVSVQALWSRQGSHPRSTRARHERREGPDLRVIG